ncbi:MAG: BlaI/MecI/CopY family transcriptional regulator [Bacteroidales bacterium]|nr:BlaI/MecI/CopY family transcriptional regulator [Bacteroidales bacterium]
MSKKEEKLELTRAEEEVMQILWQINKGFVKNMVEMFPDPKPAYNTVSTIVRILETKGFVGHTAYGKTHEYYPLVAKDEYRKKYLNSMLHNYFGGSFRQMASFFVKNEKMDTRELEEILNLMKKELEKPKSSKQ